MQRAQLLDFLAREIVTRRKAGRPFKVGIDGRGAAGKTALADDLGTIFAVRGIDVVRASIDGFHHPRERRYRQGEDSARGYYEDAFDYDAVVPALLKPLSGHTFPVNCRPVSFDLHADQPADVPPRNVTANAILLFDGLFLFREKLNPYWDYRILLDVDAATSLARALTRDTESTPDLIRRKYAVRYEPAWQIYESEEHPQVKADVRIDYRQFADPQILT